MMSNNVLDSVTNKAVYEFIVFYTDKHGFAPSYKEMSGHLDISTYEVSHALKRLETGGYIQREKRKPRAIKLCHYKLMEVL